MYKKQLFLLVLLASLTVNLFASIPSGYYNNANNKCGATLKTALASIISSNVSKQSYAALWAAYETTDTRSWTGGDGKMWDRYANTSMTYGTNQDSGSGGTVEGDKYNREHSWPKSWFGGSTSAGPGTDLHHVICADKFANNKRSDNILAEVKTATWTGSISKLGTGGYGSKQSYTVFEPADEYKGDFARIYFYMVTMYQSNLSSWNTNYSSENVSKIIDGSTYPAFQTWYLEMLLAWAKADPVDYREVYRNDAVYAIQGNRNPFIDYPGLEDYVWGDHKTTNVDLNNYTDPYSGGGTTTTVATPTFSPAAGTYTSAQNVTISCATSGATIYYTTDGTAPTTSSSVYGSAIAVSSTTTIKAMAVKSGMTNSEVATATYTINSGGGSSGTQLMYESVSGYTSTSDGSAAITSQNSNWDYDNWNWSAFTRTYNGKNGCIKLGSGSGIGSVITNAISLTGAATLTYKVMKYSSNSSSVNVTVTGATASGDVTATPSSNSSWDDCTVNITGATGSITIQFASSNKQIYIDEIRLVTASSTQEQVETPTFSPAAGTYTSAQSVTISCTTSGATIYYTTDGSTPTTSSSVYSSAIPVSSTTTIKAMAVKSGMTNSEVATATYTINLPQVATPTFSPAAGTYTSAQSVTISSTTSGATIYYTTDGSTPTTSSSVYSSAISVSSTTTIKAMAVKSGYTNSEVATATYTINLPQAATPTFSPAAGTYTSAQSVTISSTTSGATIYYTTDGSTPTTSSSVYSSAISVSSTTTIKAIAVLSGYTNSEVATATYTINSGGGSSNSNEYELITSTNDLESGKKYLLVANNSSTYYAYTGVESNWGATTTVTPSNNVINIENTTIVPLILGGSSGAWTLQDETNNYYLALTSASNVLQTSSDATLSTSKWSIGTDNNLFVITNNGTTSSGTNYVIRFNTGANYLKFRCYKTTTTTSVIYVQLYKQKVSSTPTTVEAPTFSPGEGTYNSAQTVTISSATSGASIYYTTDNTTPSTSNGTQLTNGGSVTISSSCTLKAVAVLSGTTSSVTSGTYTINLPASVEAPVFSVGTGTYTSVQNVTITSATSGAVIYYTTDGSTPTTSSASLTNGATITISSSCTLKAIAYYNNASSTVTSATYTINISGGGSGSARYEKITSTSELTSGGQYLIVYEDGNVAFNGSLSTLDAASNNFAVTIESGSPNYIEATTDIDNKSFTITASGNDYTIQSASGYYVGRTANSNGMNTNTTTQYTNTIDFNTAGYANIVGSGGAYMRYNSNNDQKRFRYFTSSTYGGQKAVYLYKRVTTGGSATETIEVPISSLLYGTLYYSDRNLVVPANMIARTYNFNVGNPNPSWTYQSGDVIPAGTGVVLIANSAGTYEFEVTTDNTGHVDENSCMRGSDVTATTTGDGIRYYKLSLNSAGDPESVGFYWGAAEGGPFTNGAHKAYLVRPASAPEQANVSGFPFSDQTTGISGIDNPQLTIDKNAAVYTLDGRRVMNTSALQKGIYIVNGKKVVVK